MANQHTNHLNAFQTLGIVACGGFSELHEEQIRAAGYDLDAILAEEGIASERLHDALFLTTEIARITIGANYERVSGSIKSCNRATERLPSSSNIVDLGGASGIICFEAAMIRPDCNFAIADRSQNALTVGRRWAETLNLQNVKYTALSFSDAQPKLILGAENDFVMLEYVFDVGGACENEDDAINDFKPGLWTASRILKRTGAVQIRFGESGEVGLTALIRAAYRTELLMSSLSVAPEGCTLVFRKDYESHSENLEVSRAINEFASEMWR